MTKHISVTQLNQYIRCGEQYRRRYIENEIIPPDIALVKGISVHKTSEYNFKQKKETLKDLKKKELIEFGINQFDTIIKNEGIVLAKEDESIGKDVLIDKEQKSVKTLIELYSEDVAPQYIPQDVEIKQVIEIPTIQKPILGVIDMIDKDGKIVELKTSSKKAQQETYDKSLQLTAYALTYHVINKKPPTAIEVNVLIDKNLPETQRITTNRDVNDYEVLGKRLKVVLNSIEKGIFVPTNPDNWWCSERFCGYYRTCPYVKQNK